jgi:hypothetical protein
MSFAWTRRNQFIFHLLLSLCTYGSADSYHVNIGIIKRRSSFDGTIENEEALKHQDGKFVFGMIKNIKVIFSSL